MATLADAIKERKTIAADLREEGAAVTVKFDRSLRDGGRKPGAPDVVTQGTYCLFETSKTFSEGGGISKASTAWLPHLGPLLDLASLPSSETPAGSGFSVTVGSGSEARTIAITSLLEIVRIGEWGVMYQVGLAGA